MVRAPSSPIAFQQCGSHRYRRQLRPGPRTAAQVTAFTPRSPIATTANRLLVAMIYRVRSPRSPR